MEVRLTASQEEFVRHAIEAGRVASSEDAVREALVLWEERERRWWEILAAVDEAEASLAQCEGHPITEASMTELAQDIGRRGRERLAQKSKDI